MKNSVLVSVKKVSSLSLVSVAFLKKLRLKKMCAFFPLLHRLLEELVQKEREFQVLLHQAIEEKDQEIKNLRLRSQPIGK